MNKKIFILPAAILACLANKANGQQAVLVDKTNVIKANLTAPILNSYVVQFEKVAGKKQSVGFSFGISPNSSLPLQDRLFEEFGNNADVKRAIEHTRYFKYNATLEYRFYTGEFAPKGFYVAPFFRYMHLRLEQDYQFTINDNEAHEAKLSGTINGIGVGVMVGYQWLINKHWAVDLWIAGPFYGTTLRGNFEGVDPQGNLTLSQQQQLEQNIEDYDIPGYTVDAHVTQNASGPTTVNMVLRGPYYGIRMLGVCIGYRF